MGATVKQEGDRFEDEEAGWLLTPISPPGCKPHNCPPPLPHPPAPAPTWCSSRALTSSNAFSRRSSCCVELALYMKRP